MTVEAVVLSNTSLITPAGGPHVLEAGTSASLFGLLTIAHPHALSVTRAREVLDANDAALQTQVHRLRVWLRQCFPDVRNPLPFKRDMGAYGAGGAYALALPGGVQTDWQQFRSHFAAAKAIRRATDKAEVVDLWQHLSRAVALLPQTTAPTGPLPSLSLYADRGLVANVMMEISEARRMWAEAGLRLGYASAVVEGLRLHFDEDRQSAAVASLLARAEAELGDQKRAVAVIEQHRQALHHDGHEMSEAMKLLLNSILSPDSREERPSPEVTAPSTVAQRMAREGGEQQWTIPRHGEDEVSIALDLTLDSHLVSSSRHTAEGPSLDRHTKLLEADWFQVTYDPQDRQMAGPPWSIELVSVSHQGDLLRGRMWRIWPDNFQRRWDFALNYQSPPLLQGVYQASRDTDGGNGTLHVVRASCCLFVGAFFETQHLRRGPSLSLTLIGAPLVWLRAERAVDSSLRRELAEVSLDPLKHHLPPDVTTRLAELLGKCEKQT